MEEFEVVETLDGITCDICQSMDGKHFPMSDFSIGETAPPFHPRCRGCVCPYFDDEFSHIGERTARGEDGKTYYVPADMTYQKWKDSFVDGGDKSGLQRMDTNDKINAMDITKDWTSTKENKGIVIERQEYIVNGITYKVDGKHVVLHPTNQEREVAEVLSRKYGKTVEFVPQIMYPQGIQTPELD